MKIAVAQLDAAETNIDRRWTTIDRAVTQAAGQGARITVLPELAISGYGAGPDILASAEGVAGGQVARLKKLACDTGTALVSGIALKSDERVYNSAVFVTPDGMVEAYNKIHLYGDYENGLFAPGIKASPIFSFEGLKFGLLVCFDVEFPERVRDLAMRGAQAVLVPTALPKSEGGAFIAESVVPVRAFENSIFVAYANHAGRDDRFTFQGQSCIAAPDGRMLAQGAASSADLLVAGIDPAAYEACRVQNPYLEVVRGSPIT